VTPEDRQRIEAVTQMAPAMRERAAALWAIEEKRDANRTEIDVRLEEVKELGAQLDKRVGNLRRKFEGQERFAKGALFESFAYKTIVEAIDGLRSGIRNAPSDEGTVNSAVMQAETLLAELDTMKALVSEKVMQGLLPVREAADGLL